MRNATLLTPNEVAVLADAPKSVVEKASTEKPMIARVLFMFLACP
jgi:hypothetical protein